MMVKKSEEVLSEWATEIIKDGVCRHDAKQSVVHVSSIVEIEQPRGALRPWHEEGRKKRGGGDGFSPIVRFAGVLPSWNAPPESECAWLG